MERYMLLTVFTPTYNRAHTLPRLYESLKGQSAKNFEWLIVDDGSNDNTRECVDAWAREGLVDIRYIYQENSGKPSAHNRGAEEARGDLFFCVDSDDYLTPDAVHVISDAINEADGCVGILAYKMLSDGKCVTGLRDARVTSFTLKDGYDHYGLTGDTALIFKTDVLRRFAFPIFEGEKFIPEGYLYDKIDTAGKLLVVRESVYICEYLNDGYTANMKRTLYKNPQGYFEYIENRLRIDKDIRSRLLDSIRYMAMAIAHKKPRRVRDAVYPLIALLAYLPGYLLYLRDFKRYKNERSF